MQEISIIFYINTIYFKIMIIFAELKINGYG